MIKKRSVFFNLIIGLLGVSVSSAQDKNLVDSLIRELPKAKGLDKVILLTDISFYAGFYDNQLSEEKGLEALQLANELKDDKAWSEAYNNLAIVTYRTGKMQESLDYNHQALKIRKRLKDQRGIASSMSKIGNVFIEQSVFDSALYYQQECLKLFEEVGDKRAVGQTLNNLSHLHKKLGNYELMKKYALESAATYQGIDFDYGIATSYGNVAVYYEKVNKPDSSITWSLKALELFTKIGALYDIAACENNLGLYYRKSGNTDEGLKHYLEAYRIGKSIGDENGSAQYGTNVARVYHDQKKYALATRFYEEAKIFAEVNKLHQIRTQIYDGLSEVYAAQGNFKSAYQSLVQFQQLNDSLFNAEKTEMLTAAEAKYRTARREKELSVERVKSYQLAQEKAEAELEISNRNKWIIGVASSSLTILFLILFLTQRQRRKIQAEKDASIILERERGLESVIIATEEERKRIARELHDGIGQQLGGLKMAWQQLESQFKVTNEKETEKLKELTKILDDSATELREISHQMMPKVLSEIGLVAALEDMLKKTFAFSTIQYEFETHGIDQRPKETIEISLYRICQELLTNIIKHSGATHVVVQLFKNKNYLILIVEDNGKGFDHDGKAEGIGLLNISSRLSTVKGDVNYQPSPGSGTVATVRVPL